MGQKELVCGKDRQDPAHPTWVAGTSGLAPARTCSPESEVSSGEWAYFLLEKAGLRQVLCLRTALSLESYVMKKEITCTGGICVCVLPGTQNVKYATSEYEGERCACVARTRSNSESKSVSSLMVGWECSDD